MPILKVCEFCGKEFSIYPYNDRARFCSKECHYESRRRRRTKKMCEFCGKAFFVPKSREGKARFCSPKCWYAFSQKPRTERICLACGKRFSILASKAKWRRRDFCSRQCWFEASSGELNPNWKKIKKTCVICGSEFEVPPSRKQSFCCSKRCSGRWYSKTYVGEKAHRWLGGKSFEPYPPEFNEPFKRLIRERDNYTCVICHLAGKQVHHINYNKADTVPGNCITLCSACHNVTNLQREYWEGALFALTENRAVRSNEYANA